MTASNVISNIRKKLWEYNSRFLGRLKLWFHILKASKHKQIARKKVQLKFCYDKSTKRFLSLYFAKKMEEVEA